MLYVQQRVFVCFAFIVKMSVWQTSRWGEQRASAKKAYEGKQSKHLSVTFSDTETFFMVRLHMGVSAWGRLFSTQLRAAKIWQQLASSRYPGIIRFSPAVEIPKKMLDSLDKTKRHLTCQLRIHLTPQHAGSFWGKLKMLLKARLDELHSLLNTLV